MGRGAPSRKLRASRKALSKGLQVRVFCRDHWLCRWCGRPVVFAPAMKYLERHTRQQGYQGPLAYFDPRWRRDASPLLDHLAAVVDHVEAYSRGGADDESNFVTACNKCNMRKNSDPVEHFTTRSPRRPVKAKYGEPIHWDGLSTLFVLLLSQDRTDVTKTDEEWLSALKQQQHTSERV